MATSQRARSSVWQPPVGPALIWQALSGFTEGTYDFAPTFKVKRDPGMHHKDQRIPSYCDRVLWRSMPPLKANVQQTMLTSVPGVSTSDHKPVASAFHITPTMPLVRVRQGAPLVRLEEISISDVVDGDVTGGSDPYIMFLTNPPEVLSAHHRAPISKVKTIHRGMSKTMLTVSSTVTGAHVTGAGSSSTVSESDKKGGRKMSGADKKGADDWTTFSHKELPLLRPLVESSELSQVTLLLAILDHDLIGKDDLLGVIRIPLANPTGGSETQYEILVDSPIELYTETQHTGRIKARLTVTTGEDVEEALRQAREDGVGQEASSLNLKGGCCKIC